MFDKVLEIITYILEDLKHSKNIFDIDFASLMKSGYSNKDINTALAWIFSKFESGESIIREEFFKSNSKRIYSPEELSLFTTEALGYLTTIYEMGLIGEIEREMIIDRLQMTTFSKVTIREIKTIIASILINFDSSSDLKKRLILNNNETIH